MLKNVTVGNHGNKWRNQGFVVAYGADVTLNGNGYQITSNQGEECASSEEDESDDSRPWYSVFWVEDGNLVLNNLKVVAADRNIYADYDLLQTNRSSSITPEPEYSYVYVDQEGNLTLNHTNVEAYSSKNGSNYIFDTAILVEGGSLTVNSGMVSGYYSGIFGENNANITINGGTIKNGIQNSDDMSFIKGYAALTLIGGTAAINGGTFYGSTPLLAVDNIQRLLEDSFDDRETSVVNPCSSVAVAVSGGTFTGTCYGTMLLCDAELTGGTFKCTYGNYPIALYSSLKYENLKKDDDWGYYCPCDLEYSVWNLLASCIISK